MGGLANGQPTENGQRVANGSAHKLDKVAAALDTKKTYASRQRCLGTNISTHMVGDKPLHMVRGQGCYLYDADDEEYLDCMNNVAHLGHAHPKVTAAVCQQMMTLNTNIRFIHDAVADHAAALVATLPEPLEVVYHVNSGSEANDLAIRLATTAKSGATHFAVMGGAYHGHTAAVLDLSPYKWAASGGSGQPAHIHVLPAPDMYRQKNLNGRQAAKAAIAEAHAAGGRIAAFFAESILSCAGQLFFPDGYLQEVYEEMRAEGAICVADEIQVGFGRTGSHFWAFQQLGVVPDVVTMGKPIGNGFPMSALVTTRRLAHAFSNGMEFTSTFGGCTAAGVAGLATLQAIHEEGLQKKAKQVGSFLLQRLKAFAQEFDVVGDVRGAGLMIGIEIVEDSVSKAPSAKFAKGIKNALGLRHVLLSVDGVDVNVLKIKPPMCFSVKNAQQLISELGQVLKGKEYLRC